MKKNLRQNISILVVVICFLGFGFASANSKAQTKNSKTKPTPTPPKTKKSPTPTPKTTKTTSTKNDKSKNSTVEKTTKTSDKSKKSAKNNSEKDKKSEKNKKVEKDKKTTSRTANTTPKSLPPKTANKPKQTIVKEKIVTQPKTANISDPTVSKPINPQKLKPTLNQKVIVLSKSVQVMSEPDLASSIVQTLHIGTVLTLMEKNDNWYKVLFAGDQNAVSGWVLNTAVMDFSQSRRDEIYQSIVDRNFKNDAMDFTTAAELYDFLTVAQREITEEKLLADLSFKRLLTLQTALKTVPRDKSQENLYQNFFKNNEQEIVYSEPAAEWLVRLEKFWQLHNKYKHLPISEEIAWQAANSPIAGECVGYINCYLYKIRTTFGEYLNFYPSGNHSKEALKTVSDFLQPIAADVSDRKIYYAASDTSDRAEFNRLLTELRTIISKVPQLEKAKTIQQINQIAEGYR